MSSSSENQNWNSNGNINNNINFIFQKIIVMEQPLPENTYPRRYRCYRKDHPKQETNQESQHESNNVEDNGEAQVEMEEDQTDAPRNYRHRKNYLRKVRLRKLKRYRRNYY